MKRTKLLTYLTTATVACAVGVPHSLLAAGISLYEIATPDVGLASAGYAARAQDASTLFKNPAGMSRLEDAQLQSGLQLLYADAEFSKNANTSASLGNNNGGNAIGALPSASLFITYPVAEKLTLGFGAFSYFGLAEKFDNDWVGRYYVQNGTLLGMSLMPSASYKVTDWLSVGAGLNAMFGYLDTEVAINTLGAGDGQLKLQDQTWGFGGNFGLLVEPVKGTRFGVTYLSEVKLDFEDRPKFRNLGPLGGLPIFQTPPNLKLGMTVPQMVMVGAYHELNAKWAVMADVGWQDWSQFGKVDVGVDSANPTSLTTNLKYEDTYHGAVGAQYKYNDRWQFSGGVAYDSSAVSDKNRTVTLPMGEAYRFGLGVQHQLNKKIELGTALEFIWAGDMPVSQTSTYRGNVAGSFDNAWFTFLSAHLTWHL